MDRRDFLALAASVPLLTTPASAADASPPAQSEQASEGAEKCGTDTIEIDVRLT
jgi:opacity protein-like surface antigen